MSVRLQRWRGRLISRFARAATLRERLTRIERLTESVDADAQARDTYWHSPGGIRGGLLYSTERWGLDPGLLRKIQGESAASLARRVARSKWEDQFDQAHQAIASPNAIDPHRGNHDDWFRDLGAAAPTNYLWRYFQDKLQDGLTAFPQWIEPTSFNQAGPPWQILGQVARAVTLEYQLWVQAGKEPAGFIEKFSVISECVDFFEIYPALARSVTEQLSLWVESRLELATRLANDYPSLNKAFGITGRVRAVEMDAGDTHNGGRSVAIVKFDSGARVVYKPRSLQQDAYFANLVDSLESETTKLRVPVVVDSGGYGWAEYVEPAPCDESNLGRFYAHHGALLALLHIHGSTDFHYENVIAADEFPVPIDLETILQPEFERRFKIDSSTPSEVIEQVLGTVLRTALLPQPVLIGESEPMDMSAIGGPIGQLSPSAGPVIAGWGTSTAHVRRERQPIEAAHNSPFPSVTSSSAGHHVDDVVRGFEDAYQLVRRLIDRQSTRALTGLIDPSLLTRVVIRPTMQYAKLLTEVHHPDLAEDGLDRSFFWEALGAADSVMEIPSEVLDFEISALERGDVPAFYCSAYSTDLVDHEGTVIRERYFSSSPVEAFENRLRALDESDMKRQVWLIRASLSAFSDGAEKRAVKVVEQAARPGHLPETEVRDAVVALADDLVASAVESADGYLYWPSILSISASSSAIIPARDDLGNGRGGAALFLLAAGMAFGRRDLVELGMQCHDSMWSAFELAAIEGRTSRVDAGLLSTLSALLSFEWHLIDSGGAELRRPTEAIMGVLEAAVDHAPYNDYFSGSSGLIPHLERWAIESGDRSLFQLSELCVRSALTRARIGVEGVSGVGLSDRDPIGVAHGLSGVTEGISYYSGRALRDDVRAFVRSAWDAEDRLASASYAGPFDGGWCSGPIGVNRSRDIVRDRLGIKTGAGWVEKPADLIAHARVMTDLTMCHGRSGVLLCGRGIVGEAELADATQALAANSVEQLSTGRLLSSPGLVDGSAGVGLSMLALSGHFEITSVFGPGSAA